MADIRIFQKLARIKLELEEQEHNVAQSYISYPKSVLSKDQLKPIAKLFEEIESLLPDASLSLEITSDPVAMQLAIHDTVKYLQERMQTMKNPVSKKRGPDRRRVFVVHGRNNQARDAMFTFLQDIGLDPIEWGDAIAMTGHGSPSNLAIIDRAFSNAHAAVVLVTGEDMARLGKKYLKPDDKNHERRLTSQARSNVIFEMGMAFGRYPERTIIVEYGSTRTFTDIDGINTVRFGNDAESRHLLASRLKTAKCQVRTSGRTKWLKLSTFPDITSPDDDGKPTVAKKEDIRIAELGKRIADLIAERDHFEALRLQKDNRIMELEATQSQLNEQRGKALGECQRLTNENAVLKDQLLQLRQFVHTPAILTPSAESKVFSSPTGISIEIKKHHRQNLTGFAIVVKNNSASSLLNYVVTITKAGAFEILGNSYVSIENFAVRTAMRVSANGPRHSTEPAWLVRRHPNALDLLIGNDPSSSLPWPTP
jgi:predicted nucleotide-binding protein